MLDLIVKNKQQKTICGISEIPVQKKILIKVHTLPNNLQTGYNVEAVKTPVRKSHYMLRIMHYVYN